jgi:hypothetical protein
VTTGIRITKESSPAGVSLLSAESSCEDEEKVLTAMVAAKNAKRFKEHHSWLRLRYHYRQHDAGDLGWIVAQFDI